MADLTPRQQLDRIKAKQASEKAEQKALMSVFGGASAGLVVNTGATILMTKFPRLASIDKNGRVQTRFVVGGPLFLGGLASKGDLLGNTALFAGYGMLAQGFDRWASTWDFAQPSA